MNTTTTTAPCRIALCDHGDQLHRTVDHIKRPGTRYLWVRLAAVARGRAAARIAEAGLMARAARAQLPPMSAHTPEVSDRPRVSCCLYAAEPCPLHRAEFLSQ